MRIIEYGIKCYKITKQFSKYLVCLNSFFVTGKHATGISKKRIVCLYRIQFYTYNNEWCEIRRLGFKLVLMRNWMVERCERYPLNWGWRRKCSFASMSLCRCVWPWQKPNALIDFNDMLHSGFWAQNLGWFR